MAIRQTRARMAAFCSLMFVLATHVVAAEPKEGYSKVLVGKRFLFSQPNASAPPPLAGLDAEIIEEYDDFSLVSAANSARDAVTSQVIASGFEATVREDFDYVFINGHRIDTRLGTEKSLPNRKLDPLYPAVEKGAWLVQFVGPIKDEWLKIVATAEITVVQYVPNNACIVGADAAAIQVAARLPFVQFTDQLHTFMKPSIGPRDLASELWILRWIEQCGGHSVRCSDERAIHRARGESGRYGHTGLRAGRL